MQETLDYLYGLERFGIKLGLEVTEQILSRLGNPHRQFKSVHIVGTNGKGSTLAFLSTILRNAGYRIGTYTSPHLIQFNERIQTDTVMIADEELVSLTEEIKEKIYELQPTFFEFTTALAFLYFSRKKIDIAIIEAGMGGRLDATCVLNPLLTIITNVSLDHTNYLGTTLLDIAKDKAGAIRCRVPLVTAERNMNILKIFEEQCHKNKSPMILVKGTENNYTPSLLGNHQKINASLAVVASRHLPGFAVPETAIQNGIETTVWPGRLEIISRTPLVMIDGAHNVASMEAICSYLTPISRRRVLILGIADDKDIPAMVKLIAPLFETVIVSQGNYKPAETAVIAREACRYCADVREIIPIQEALRTALSLVENDQLLFITGSLYLVGDVLKHRNEFKDWASKTSA